jgi:hypothetical protein
MAQLDRASTELQRYEILQALGAVNIQLFYYCIIHNLKRLAPIIYTPTVGKSPHPKSSSPGIKKSIAYTGRLNRRFFF